jgi:tetratricopeptide (TPR) repeat protein
VNKQAGLLRGVCFLGLGVSLVLFGALFFLSYYGDIPLFSFGGGGKSSFALALEEYDQTVRDDPSLSFRQHNNLLYALEKKALDTENILSVLKRRRHLAFRPSEQREQHLSAYISAAGRAQKLFPHSSQVSALAAEAIILSARPLPGEAAAELSELAALLYGTFQDLSLAFSVYSGAMSDPAAALSLPRELFPLICSLAQGEEREKYLVNSCLRTILENNPREAMLMVNSLFESTPLLDGTIRFGGEFFYDHGNYLRAAEFFSSFTDDQSLARQADSLWLAGFIEAARGLWRAAVSQNRTSVPGFEEIDVSAIKARSYYNLASTAPNGQESGHWLEQLFAAGADYQPGQVFGIIRYSRLLPQDKALAVLERTQRDLEGLYDLELLRRRNESWTVDRAVAETWLMLNRHPEDGRLFEWAVWFFDFQRRYEETVMALRNAGNNQVEGPWAALHRAFALMRSSKFKEAEQALRSIVRSPQETGKAPGRFHQPLWQASADLAMLLERQRDYQEALQYYEIASNQLLGLQAGSQADAMADALVEPPDRLPDEGEGGLPAAGISVERRDAARIQLCIARVLRSLGKNQESIRVLDYALDLDPGNLEAKMEKRRLGAERSIL